MERKAIKHWPYSDSRGWQWETEDNRSYRTNGEGEGLWRWMPGAGEYRQLTGTCQFALPSDEAAAVAALEKDGFVLADGAPVVLQPIHLGSGAEGQRRRAVLERLAAEAGHTWGGKPSIGRWLVALADAAQATE